MYLLELGRVIYNNNYRRNNNYIAMLDACRYSRNCVVNSRPDQKWCSMWLRLLVWICLLVRLSWLKVQLLQEVNYANTWCETQMIYKIHVPPPSKVMHDWLLSRLMGNNCNTINNNMCIHKFLLVAAHSSETKLVQPKLAGCWCPGYIRIVHSGIELALSHSWCNQSQWRG